MATSTEALARLAATPWPQLGVASAADLERFFAQLAAGLDPAAQPREFWFGRRNGLFAQLNERWLKSAPPEWKRGVGAGLNQLKLRAEAAYADLQSWSAAAALQQRLEAERLDVTLPAPDARAAPAHPVLQVMDEIVGIFARLGYSAVESPEIETSFFNFEALNIPEGHPAREEQDTLYLAGAGNYLLRTHTSPGQIRTMQRQPPPLRVVVPGKVYRRDAPDASHSPMFHQIEGLAVDAGITLRDLKGTLDHFAAAMFGAGVETRFRPSYFPFTEPSAEMDVSCIFCRGAGCRTCKQSGWIEVLGCGMVHPAVFEQVGPIPNLYDPEQYTGFAFGMGVERMAMIRCGVDDIQRFYSGDLRFLGQFRT